MLIQILKVFFITTTVVQAINWGAKSILPYVLTRISIGVELITLQYLLKISQEPNLAFLIRLYSLETKGWQKIHNKIYLFAKQLEQWSFIKLHKYNKIMSGKSKKTTTDKTIYNEKQTKYISHSATKMVNRLSLSFYDENTLKMQKQVILDTYDDYQSETPLRGTITRPVSLSKEKILKHKTPLIKFIKHQNQPVAQQPKSIKNIKQNETTIEKKIIKLSKQRSSSKSSRGKNSSTSAMFNYINNRIQGSTKGWSQLRAIQCKNNNIKKV